MIELKNVSKKFYINKEEITALKDINLHIKPNELVILKGKSGSGKSTLLSLISALSKPTSGEIIVDGKKVSKLSDEFASKFRLKNVGIVFQRYNLINEFSVYENLLAPIIPLNPNKEEIDKKISLVLKEFEIEDKKDTKVKLLSGGEQQRVAICRSVINDPKVIVADEPTANLDKKLSLEFIKFLKKLKQKQKTIVVATHDELFFDLDFVDRVINISGGEIC
jgi:putative ABC transport system ATP-binding protein